MSYQALIRIRFSTINSANNIISYANYDAAALAVAASAQWIANFAITMTFPIMLANIGLAGAYGFYALSALISLFFVVKYIKETRGKTLESMWFLKAVILVAALPLHTIAPFNNGDLNNLKVK